MGRIDGSTTIFKKASAHSMWSMRLYNCNFLQATPVETGKSRFQTSFSLIFLFLIMIKVNMTVSRMQAGFIYLILEQGIFKQTDYFAISASSYIE